MSELNETKVETAAQEAACSAAEAVQDTVQAAADNAQGAVQAAVDEVQDAAQAVADEAQDAAQAAADEVKDAAQAAADEAQDAAQAAADEAQAAGETAKEAASDAKDNLSDMVSAVSDLGGQVLEAGKEFAVKAAKIIGSAIENSKDIVADAEKSSIEGTERILEKAGESVEKFTQKVQESAQKHAEQEESDPGDKARDAADKFSKAAEKFSEKAEKAAETGKKVLAEAAGIVEQAARAVKEKMSQPAQDAPTESMADYDDQITASFRPIHEGDLLTGTVIGISDDEIVLDFGTYTDGVIKLKDASDDPTFSFHQMEIGQKVTGTVIRRDNGEGRLQLSMKEATAVLAWDRLRKLMEDKTPVDVKITGIVKSGAVAYVEGIRGFIPASKLSLTYVEDLDPYLNQTMQVQVIAVDEEDKRLVLSARELLREKEAEEKKKRISNVEVGLVTEGTVETIKPYGAFVNIGNGMSGLLHVSQISNARIKHPSAVLKEGQTVKVKIIAVKDGKISLSMKALEDVAAEEVTEEAFDLPTSDAVTTSLASFFKNLKL